MNPVPVNVEAPLSTFWLYKIKYDTHEQEHIPLFLCEGSTYEPHTVLHQIKLNSHSIMTNSAQTEMIEFEHSDILYKYNRCTTINETHHLPLAFSSFLWASNLRRFCVFSVTVN